MPESLALVDGLRDRGLAAVVSGAGPSVLVLTTGSADLGTVRDLAPAEWAVLPSGVDGVGARVLHENSQVSSR